MARRRPSTNVPFLRRRSNLWLVGALVLLGIAALLGAISKNGSGPHRTIDATATVVTTAAPTVTSVAPATPDATVQRTPSVALLDLHPNPARLEQATVVRVIDGDTIVVQITDREEHVRYYGIDTPERGDACFSEATARNAELIGPSVLLLADARDHDRYDRLLRYVFDAQGNSVDARLIAEGYAHAWRADGAYRDQLVALEEQTDAANIGCLWK